MRGDVKKMFRWNEATALSFSSDELRRERTRAS